MATAAQVKSLIRSHFNEESERFYTIALQVAAHEAKQGHSGLAYELRNLVNQKRKKGEQKSLTFPQDLKGLVLIEEPATGKNSLVMNKGMHDRIDQIIHEYFQQEKLKHHGLSHRRKILLIGSPGTGKTMTARVLSHELHIPLHTIQVDRLVTKFMGETSAKLRQIFDFMQKEHGIYLFDEFDAIGGDRGMDNDVGEMRRVLNAFLQFIEQDKSDSIIIAATNNPKLLDHALFRRFDDVLYYEKPEEHERKELIKNSLGIFKSANFSWEKVLSKSEELSHGEIVMACNDAIKRVVLSDKKKVTATNLCTMIQYRQTAKQVL